MSKEDEIDWEKVAEQSANNFGPSPDMHHPDYGWIIKDGKTTEAGIQFFKEQLEPFEVNSKIVGRS